MRNSSGVITPILIVIMVILFFCFLFLTLSYVLKIRRLQAQWDEIAEEISSLEDADSDMYVYKLIEKVYLLGNIPDDPECFDTIRNAYKVVWENKSISDLCKQQFKTFLHAKGINLY